MWGRLDPGIEPVSPPLAGGFFFKKMLFVYLFMAVLGLHCCSGFPLTAASGGPSSCGKGASQCSGSSGFRASALGVWASVVMAHGLSACGSQTLEHRLNSCGSQSWLLQGM